MVLHKEQKKNVVELLNTTKEQQSNTFIGLNHELSLPREKRHPVTECDPCVIELCMAIEECLVLGLKPRYNTDHREKGEGRRRSVLSVLSAAFLAETDVGKARCWLKIALNNHTIESSIMVLARLPCPGLMVFSMACEHLIHDSYEERSLVRCSEGLGLFLELIIALREVHFAIKVSGEPFQVSKPAALARLEPIYEGDSGELVSAITDEDIAAAVGELKIKDANDQRIQDTVTVEEDVIQFSSALFPHRRKSIKPWQYVFGISLASLTKNPYHSRYALIDPLLALPNVLNDCVAILRQNPDTPRLFRTTVLNIRVNQLREIVETKGAVPEDLDPQCAGALLLDFLKNLPDSLLTDDKYDAFVAAGQLRDEDASVRNVTCLVNDLPVPCQIVLKHVISLMHFLQQPEHSGKNGVDIFTASTILAPAIAFKSNLGSGSSSERPRGQPHSPHQDLRYAAVGAQVVERMIRHYATIFHSVRLLIIDALEHLEAKKEALGMVSHRLKLQPQMDILSDRQQVNEISRLFRDYLEHCDGPIFSASVSSTTEQAVECLKIEVVADLENTCQRNTTVKLGQDLQKSTVAAPAASSTSGASLSTMEAIGDDLVSVWEQFGFNGPTIVENFEKGGVLMLQALLYWLKNDPDALSLLKMRALPSKLPSYDAGLVASSICESLVKLLKLSLTPKCPEVDMVAMSLEPFWKLFDEDMFFNKLFMLMFLVFDRLWSELDPNTASFAHVITETEEHINELLKEAPTTAATVKDLQVEWKAIQTRRCKEAKEEEEQRVPVEDEAPQIAATSDSSIPSPSFRRSKNKSSFDLKLDDSNFKLLDTSRILTREHVAHIGNALPITSQLCRWYCIYSVASNGSALETFLLLAKRQRPTLLVIKDAEGNVFGGFASDEWHHAFHYYGTGESFLFSFASSSAVGEFMKYPWSRKNSYFMLCSDESLIMGGGGNFGLFLDSDLSSGTSGACETFDSPPLTPSQQFSCVQLELWGFTTGDKPLHLGERQRKSVLG
ncbi:unnamed protein product [Peronospora belbahrii]|uniref:Oxidation resistance protein 1 n=1 Tax=Peronospora belbahrii TaxID=622444 RepID=A0AAU9KRC8_9STRA|nr:unnamed protein product [Peronospora belbahrii]